MAAFALASLSVMGIPPTSGFVSKWYLALGTVEADHWILLGVLLVSSLLNAAYLGPIVYKAYFEEESATNEEVREVPWMVAPLVITAAASLLLGLYPRTWCSNLPERSCHELLGKATGGPNPLRTDSSAGSIWGPGGLAEIVLP